MVAEGWAAVNAYMVAYRRILPYEGMNSMMHNVWYAAEVMRMLVKKRTDIKSDCFYICGTVNVLACVEEMGNSIIVISGSRLYHILDMLYISIVS